MLIPPYPKRLRNQEPRSPSYENHAPLPLPVVFERVPAPQWEYQVLVIDPREEEPPTEDRLNALGNDGWLLASVIEAPAGRSATRLYYYFVRARVADDAAEK